MLAGTGKASDFGLGERGGTHQLGVAARDVRVAERVLGVGVRDGKDVGDITCVADRDEPLEERLLVQRRFWIRFRVRVM